MKAVDSNITNIQQGPAAGGVSGVADKTLFGNEVGSAGTGEFANLMDILGGGKKAEGADLLEMLKAAKENPEALGKLPKEVLQFIGQEFQFDGKNIINQEGGPIQVEDIITKIQEVKPELLNAGKKANPDVIAGKNAEAMEVRNLLKSHDLGFDNTATKTKSLFSSGDDFVQVKESVQSLNLSDMKKSVMPKSMNGLNQYSKESKNLETNIISNSVNVEIPEAAVGMTQFKDSGSEFGMQQAGKAVDLSNINASDKTSLIDQVTKLIEQNNIKSSDSMEVTVKHDELGKFKIEVSRNADTNQLDLKIISKDKAGHNFFVENETQLAKSLNQSGIKLGNIKVAMSSENLFSSNSDSSGKDLSQGFSQNRGQQGQFGERQGESTDSERRRHLWQAFKENAEHASA